MSACIEKLPGAAFLAYPEKTDFLTAEIQQRFPHYGKPVFYGDLLYYPEASNPVVPYWCKSAMLSVSRANFSSIGEAASLLKQIQRNWAPYQFAQFRRAALIQEKLPYLNFKPKNFPFKIPDSPMGLYTLLDANTMLFSEKTSSVLPAGTIQLVEDHENPPSRAYLKLQEALIRFSHIFSADIPSQGQRCFDAGACPGGWTWVLRQLGCNVTAVDRAPLVPSLMNDPEVSFMTHDAFTLKPSDMGHFDWVFSDVICYPERLYGWVSSWLDSGLCDNMICTIKMQGGIDWPLVEKFASIPDSHVVHLCYNKHELTWMHCKK